MFAPPKSLEDLPRAIAFKENLTSLHDLKGKDTFGDQDYVNERSYFVKEYKDQAPDILKNCRTRKDFVNNLRQVASGNRSWQARREFVDSSFTDFLNLLEFNEESGLNKELIVNNNIGIILQQEIFSHVKELFNDKHYSTAVEESYKLCRKKLKSITGKEKATEAFKEDSNSKIFGHEPKDEVEKNFFDGVKFLHMAIQHLRNEKAHTPKPEQEQEMDKNLALHYIALASLAYNLIDKK